MITQRPCERCGRPIYEGEPRHPGRPRRWCSDACRRADHSERRALERGLRPKPDLDQAVEVVLQAPAACRRVLRQVADWTVSGALDEARWSSVAVELARLLRQTERGSRDTPTSRARTRW